MKPLDRQRLAAAAELYKTSPKLTVISLGRVWGVQKSTASRVICRFRANRQWPYETPKHRTHGCEHAEAETARLKARGLGPAQVLRVLQKKGIWAGRSTVYRWWGPAAAVPQIKVTEADWSEREQALQRAVAELTTPADGRPVRKQVARRLGWTIYLLERVNRRLRRRGIGLFRAVEPNPKPRQHLPTPAQIRAATDQIKRQWFQC